MAAAGLMLAHQVAGKAVRDSFFLSSHPASALPVMVMSAAAVSLIFVLAFARAISRFGPRRIVPLGFLLSAAGHAIEFPFAATVPSATSIAVYLHVVGLGAILMSGFWSLANEAFDPSSAKRVFGRITAVGTLGGIGGGILAERTAALLPANSVLLLLAFFHLACALVTATMHGSSTLEEEPASAGDIAPARLLLKTPYLLAIATLVLLGTSSAAVADYLFKVASVSEFGRGAPMLRFFALFYTSTQILTFLAQSGLSRRALAKFGIGRTLGSLPAAVGIGSMGVLLFPAFPSFVALRSLELIFRGSLFRSAYELLFTPVRPNEKRAAKTLIDVGCDRAGDALGAGIVQLLLLAGAHFLTTELLGITLLLAGVAAWISLRLDRGYSEVVQQRLVDRAVELDLTTMQDATSLSVVMPTLPAPPPEPAPAPALEPDPLSAAPDATLDTLRQLRSGDPQRVLAAIRASSPPRPLIAAQLVRLLAWDDVAGAARESLVQNVGRTTGLLIDYLTDIESAPFAVRRRIPRILAHAGSQLAVDGLLAGLADSRFEVRFQCSRALDHMRQRNPTLVASEAAVYAAIERELDVSRPMWESRHLLDNREPSDPAAYLDEHLRERAQQSLEHVFSLLATVLPREPVKVAFRALHTTDPALRGLAAEYLDGVLPQPVRTRLWSMLDQQPAAQPARPAAEAMSELLNSHPSVLLQLERSAEG